MLFLRLTSIVGGQTHQNHHLDIFIQKELSIKMVHAISKHQVINLEQHTNDEYESSIFTSCMNMYVVWTFSRHIKKIRTDNQVRPSLDSD